MADQSEIYQILLRVEGEDKVARLQAAVELAEQKFRSFQEAQRAGQVNPAAVQGAAESYARLRGELNQAETALSRMGGRSRNSGQALMEFSRAAEDAQYGISGVLNNIPGLVMAMGGGAGLIGVISLVAVGAAQLYKHWDDLAGAFGGSATKTAAEEMAELRKQTALTADEADRLSRVDSLKAKTKELQSGKSKADKKTEDAVTEAITETGNAEVVRFLRGTDEGKALIDTQGAAADVRKEIAEKERLRDNARAVSRTGQDPGGVAARMAARLDAEIKEMTTGTQSKLERARDLTAQDKVSQTTLVSEWGQKPLDDMIALVEKNQARAPDGLLDRLRKATPKGQAAELKAEGESDTVWEESQQSIAEMKKYQKKRRDDEAKALEAEAKQNEKAWDEDVRTASRTKSFKDKVTGDLTPAEKEAKRLYDQQEEGKAKEKAESDAEKRQKDHRKDIADAPGLDEFIRDQMLMGASNQQLGAMLKGMGLDEEQTTDLLGKGGKAGYEKMLKDVEGGTSQTIQGGTALRDAIQGGVQADVGQKQLARLAAMEGYLQRIADQRPDMTARAT